MQINEGAAGASILATKLGLPYLRLVSPRKRDPLCGFSGCEIGARNRYERDDEIDGEGHKPEKTSEWPGCQHDCDANRA
jgi:hypothetical protein